MGSSPNPLRDPDRSHLLSEKTKPRGKRLHFPARLCCVWLSLLPGLVLNTSPKAKSGYQARLLAELHRLALGS